MKRLHVLMMVCLGALCLSAEPTVVTKEKLQERDGKQIRVVDQTVHFLNGNLNYHLVLNPQNGQMAIKKWGDFMFGLKLGAYWNGGWDNWEFLKVFRGRKNLLREGVAKVSLMHFKEGTLAQFTWPHGLIVRMIQLNNMREWLFLQVQDSNPLDLVQLRALPGGAHWGIKGRESHVTDSVNDINSVKKQTELSPAKPGLALYSRNYHEKYGNLLVFKPAEWKKITTQGVREVALDFQAQEQKNSVSFAMGYFFNQSAPEAMGRFFSEQLPNVVSALEGMNWQPQPDLKAYEKDFNFVKDMLAKQGTQEQKAAFEKLQKRYAAAVKDRKAEDVSQIMTELESFRRSLGTGMLNRWR